MNAKLKPSHRASDFQQPAIHGRRAHLVGELACFVATAVISLCNHRSYVKVYDWSAS